jgi:hypothetical protein
MGSRKMNREQIDQYFKDNSMRVLLMDGFDEAFLGYSQRINEPEIAIYSYQKMIDTLIERDQMDYDEAVEYIDYNCLGAWVGKRTPIIVMPIEL